MGKKREGGIVGAIVLVESQPGSEGLPRAGELGHVVSVSSAGETIEVAFSDGKLGRYNPDELLTLHSSEIILNGLLKDWKISYQDCRAVLQVIRLLRTGDIDIAFQCARTNEIIRAFCLVRLSTCLNLTKTQRKKTKGIGGI